LETRSQIKSSSHWHKDLGRKKCGKELWRGKRGRLLSKGITNNQAHTPTQKQPTPSNLGTTSKAGSDQAEMFNKQEDMATTRGGGNQLLGWGFGFDYLIPPC